MTVIKGHPNFELVRDPLVFPKTIKETFARISWDNHGNNCFKLFFKVF